MRVWSHRGDLPLTLRVFWGSGGLQPTEEGANSREDPRMDDPTVSRARCVAHLLLLYDRTSKLIVVIDFHASPRK